MNKSDIKRLQINRRRLRFGDYERGDLYQGQIVEPDDELFDDLLDVFWPNHISDDGDTNPILIAECESDGSDIDEDQNESNDVELSSAPGGQDVVSSTTNDEDDDENVVRKDVQSQIEKLEDEANSEDDNIESDDEE